ncbi:MAG: hypothetical protein OEZ65_12175 [Gemmatimonadota bacterium]|nr:hypothetical protein [Gemmatimonadota bacterium]MDH5760338.1 hypothetical protein [Gemmatimonadota bacterium]
MRVLAAALGTLGAVGCATGAPRVGPADIPALEEAVSSRPQDAEARVGLGVALYRADRYVDAVRVLDGAVERGIRTGAAYLHLGLSYEALELWAQARAAYGMYLEVGRSDPLKDELRHRMDLMARRELRARAREAVAGERDAGAAPPTPRSLAVFPFGFHSDREDLEPLVYALADMMTTDFGLSGAVTVLERARLQSLLDEMSLTEAGYADPRSGARAGRMMRAEHVVQGLITDLGVEHLRLDSDVRSVPAETSVGTLTAEDELANLFDMEKDLVVRTLRDVLRVELTPQEEQAIRENRTDDLMAFLAYGRGLREMDRGDFAAAGASFGAALELDPGYQAAQLAAAEAISLLSASSTGVDDIVEMAEESGEGDDLGERALDRFGAMDGEGRPRGALRGALLRSGNDVVNPTPGAAVVGPGPDTRNPVLEAFGLDDITRVGTGTIRILILNPVGD